jgi:hypothetical protein
VHDEYLKLLHVVKKNTTDDDIRRRFLAHPPIRSFSEKYKRVFESITNREIATNPRLTSPIYYQMYLLSQVQKGALTESLAQGLVASNAMEAVLSEAVSRGQIDNTTKERMKREGFK